MRDGWESVGTFIISQPPTNVSLSPNSGALTTTSKTTLTSRYSDADGYANIANCFLLVNTTFSGANAVYVRYDANSNKLYVMNDANNAWLGGYSPGSASVVENSYCTLYCSETTVSGSGATLTVNWKLKLKPTMAGKLCSAWAMVIDDTNLRDGWDKMGSFIISQPPSNVSLVPSSGTITSNVKGTFSSKYSDPDGYANLSACYLLINSTLTGAKAAYVRYDCNANKLYVINDTNTAWIGGYSPGSANVIENSYCRLYCAETTISGSGTTLTVNWKILVKPTMAGKTCPAWMLTVDDGGLRDGWDQMGSFTVK